MRDMVRLLIFYTVLLGTTVLSSSEKLFDGTDKVTEVALMGGDNGAYDEGYLEIKINGQWVSVCSGDQGLVEAACKWAGFLKGELKMRHADDARSSSWPFEISCPGDARDVSDCTISGCKSTESKVYAVCSGVTACTMDDGTVIPGAETRLIGKSTCTCYPHNDVHCEVERICETTTKKCRDGSLATLDHMCKPHCDRTQMCKDSLSPAACNLAKMEGRCEDESIRSSCRSTCNSCPNEKSRISESEISGLIFPEITPDCADEYNKAVCGGFRDLERCGERAVQEKCMRTCGVCILAEEPGTQVVILGNDSEEPYIEAEQFGAGRSGAGQLRAEEMGRGEMRAGEMGAGDIVEGEMETREMGAGGMCFDVQDRITCEEWKLDGLCMDPSVKGKCARTCSQCTTCVDNDEDVCKVWAFEHNMCSRNRAVLKQCAGSCNLCQEFNSSNCMDIYNPINCEAWAEQGMCTSGEAPLIRKYCAKSCGVCSPEPVAVPAVDGPCEDGTLSSICEVWKGKGYCSNDLYTEILRPLCGRTCGLCGAVPGTEGPCQDEVDTAVCREWDTNETGNCGDNWTIANVLCKETCNTC